MTYAYIVNRNAKFLKTRHPIDYVYRFCHRITLFDNIKCLKRYSLTV